jgi:CBS domain-containing protein
MMRESVCVAAIIAAVFAAACGGNQNSTPAATSPAPAAPAAAPAEAPKPAGVVTLVEPIEGAMSGHIDTFRWSPVTGAETYVIQIKAVTGDRTVWESAPMTVTETKLPPTVALEPEVHTWSVRALKGSDVVATSATQRFTITP